MHLLRARKIRQKVPKDYCPLESTRIFKLTPDSELQFSEVTADPPKTLCDTHLILYPHPQVMIPKVSQECGWAGKAGRCLAVEKERRATSAKVLTRGRAKKRWPLSPEMLAVDGPDLGIIPQPDAELRLRVNKVSGTSGKG